MEHSRAAQTVSRQGAKTIRLLVNGVSKPSSLEHLATYFCGLRTP